MVKNHSYFPNWRKDVANGASHPLRIEEDEYIRVNVGIAYSDHVASQYHEQLYSRSMDELEAEVIKRFMRRREVAWAVDNSFDGLYIKRSLLYDELKVEFSCSCYLKEIQATFWKLKYFDDISR